MKKVVLSVCFIVIALSLSLPAFADSFWSYSSIVNARGLPMKVTATLNYDAPGGAQQTIKYSPDHLVFHLSNTDVTTDSLVDADIEILDNANNMSLTAGLHGGALHVKNTYTVTASFNPSTEADHPFSFTDVPRLFSMTVEPAPSTTGLMTSTAEGTLVESFIKGFDQNNARINMTFKIAGKLDSFNYPALITVTLVGTVSKTP